MGNNIILETKFVADIRGSFYIPSYQRGYPRRNLTWAGLIGWKRLMLRWMISDINAAWRVV